MTVTFESIPHEDGNHSVTMTLDGKATTIAISASEWENLQRCAKMLVVFVHPANHDENRPRKKASEDAVRDAYLAFALLNPQYRMSDTALKEGIYAPDGMGFHSQAFSSAGANGTNVFHPIMQMCMKAIGRNWQPEDAPLSAPALLEDMHRATQPKPVVTSVLPAVSLQPSQGRS